MNRKDIENIQETLLKEGRTRESNLLKALIHRRDKVIALVRLELKLGEELVALGVNKKSSLERIIKVTKDLEANLKFSREFKICQ